MRSLKSLFAVAVAVAVVATAMLVFLLIMHGRVDENAVAALPPPTLTRSDDTAVRPTVVLLRAETTARYFASLPGAAPDGYDQRIDGWRNRLEAAGARVRVLDETALVAALAPDMVLVAPSAAALHDDTLARIESAVERGTGLIATWAYGLFAPDGAWRGYEPLARIAGVRTLAEDAAADPPRYLALHGQTSITTGLPAGARIEIQPYDRPLPLTTDAAVADFVEWSMLARTGDVAAPQTAIARAAYGRGRVVWLNFEPGAVVGSGNGPARTSRLLKNALAWTSRTALGELATWPNGAGAAAALGLDAEHVFDNGAPIAARLAASAVPFTSFVLTSLVGDHADTLRTLAATSEIASHTHDHRALSEQDVEGQRAALVESQTILADRLGRPIVGLRPPEERTNDATLRALATSGYQWVVGWQEKDRAEPWVLEDSGKAVVVLPRIPHDDFEYVVRRPGEDVAAAWASMRNDLQQVRRLGGFYFFDFHTQFWDSPAIRAGVQHLTGLRNLPGVWLATVGDVAGWWRTRSRAAARVVTGADGALTVEVASGTGASALDVVVYLPDDPSRWRVERVEGEPPTAVVVGGVDGVVRLEFRDLTPNHHRLCRLVQVAEKGRAGC